MAVVPTLKGNDRKPLTDRQRIILAFIKGYVERHGTAPTFREIAEHFGFYITAAKGHVHALQRKGWLTLRRRAGTSGPVGRMMRAIVVT